MMIKQLSSYNGRSMCILLEMSTPSCVQSAWKQQLNSCTTDYCRGWTKTHFLSCCFAQESPLRHVVMTSTTNPPHESGAFQFSLTFRGPLTDLCRPVTLRWFSVHTQHIWYIWARTRPWSAVCTNMWDAQVGDHSRGALAFGAQALAFPPPAPSPLSHRVPGGQRDHDFLQLPVLCWRKGHLPASPAAEQHWHTWTSLTQWPPRWRSWNEDQDLFALISNCPQI